MLAGGFRNGREAVIILTRDSGSMAFDLSLSHEETDSRMFAGVCEAGKGY